MIRNPQQPLAWQSKAVLLLVLPLTASSVILQGHWWLTEVPVVAWTAIGISAIFGLVVWRMRAATPGGAATGALITASLMFSTTNFPYQNSWAHGALLPLLAVFLLTFIATKLGKRRKEALGLAEDRKGRNSAQVAANLGLAAVAAFPFAVAAADRVMGRSFEAISFFFALVALSEAAADTVSSEIGQFMGGRPRMITTLRFVAPGTDGGITLWGTFAGVAAALVVVTIGFWARYGVHSLLGSWVSVALGSAGGTFGLLFDSLLGATLERKGWLNNDAVNFLSTFSSVVFVLAMMGFAANYLSR